MANWSALRQRLSGIDSLTLSWDELDALVGGLPASASKHAAFWSGDRSMWTGFRARGVSVGESVTFVRFDGRTARSDSVERVPSATPNRERAARPTVDDADIVLVGCVKEKRSVPAAAKDLYVSLLFRKGRAHAEASGAAWFILSAQHGLVAPNEVLAPYDLRLSETSTEYRRAWGARVVARLAEIYGTLDGTTIDVHAGSAYADPIRNLLTDAGATVREPLAGLTLGHRLAWYDRHDLSAAIDPDQPDKDGARQYVAGLRDKSSARNPAQFLATRGDGLRSPGLYSWWVDEQGAGDLTAGIGHVISPGLVYAGLAGATRERSGKRSSDTLWGRISTMHLGGRHEFSTLRLTLGSALVDALGWEGINEAALTEWMGAHLKVVTIPVEDADALGRIETAVLAELDPPLNLSKVAATDLRRQLTSLRRQHSKKRRRQG
jgi:hypothetical protein